ncbi:MAG: hypothetical protein ACO295_03350 [Sediminibacterium sp.]
MNSIFQPLEVLREYWELVLFAVSVWLIGFNMAKRFEVIFKKDKQGRTLGERLDSIESQLHPNGGSSLADKVNKMSNQQNLMKKDIERIDSKIEDTHELVKILIEKQG